MNINTDNKRKKIVFFAVNNIGAELSGGDTIFLNFIRYWKEKIEITVIASEETTLMLDRVGLKDVTRYVVVKKYPPIPLSKMLSPVHMLKHSIVRSLSVVVYILKNRSTLSNVNYVYSVSDFYPDFIPALLSKLLNRNIKWLCGYYLFAPYHGTKNLLIKIKIK